MADDLLTFVRTAEDKFAAGDLELRRQILSTLGSNLILNDRKLSIDLENTLLPMETVAAEVQHIHDRFEPQKKPINKAN